VNLPRAYAFTQALKLFTTANLVGKALYVHNEKRSGSLMYPLTTQATP